MRGAELKEFIKKPKKNRKPPRALKIEMTQSAISKNVCTPISSSI